MIREMIHSSSRVGVERFYIVFLCTALKKLTSFRQSIKTNGQHRKEIHQTSVSTALQVICIREASVKKVQEADPE